MAESLDKLNKRLSISQSRKDLVDILDILDPDGFIIPEEIFSGKGPLGSFYRTSYEEGLHRLYGVEDYEERLEGLQNKILKELLETVISELQLYYGTNSSGYSFHDVFIDNVSPDLDNYQFLATLSNVENHCPETLNVF